MTSIPKQWVINPLSPKLEKSDLRSFLSPVSNPYSIDNWNNSQTGDSLRFSFDNISVSQSSVRVTNGDGLGDVVSSRQVAVLGDGRSGEDYWRSSTPNSPGSVSSSGSHMGFYSFVDDPTSPEAEKNEIYMISPERQARLTTLKEKSSFKLQTYTEDRKPEKLFQETNGDHLYHVSDTSGKVNDEERPDRLEIIRSQAPKKTDKEQWNTLENLDVTDSSQNLIEGFSLHYNPSSTKLLQSEVDPGAIDNQQIDFNAARKQFQMMEHTKQNPFKKSSQQGSFSPKVQERVLLAGASISPKHDIRTMVLKDDAWMSQEGKAMPVKEDQAESEETSLINIVEFGNDQQNVGSASLESSSAEPSVFDHIFMASTNETPIEREIRISQEREQDLRRSRGIFLPDTSEMVEIVTKPILSLPTPQVKPTKTKEPNRMNLLLQLEKKRANQNPGLYDRGSLQYQAERTRTFGSLSDQLDIMSLNTNPSINSTDRPVITVDTSVTDSPVREEQKGLFDSDKPLSPCCPHRHPDETVTWRESTTRIPDKPLRISPDTKEWSENESHKDKTSNQPFWLADYKPKKSRKTFTTSYPPYFSHGVKGRSNSTEDWRSRSESTSEWPRLINAPDIIRKEIEENLKREQELQELRETSSVSAAAEPTSRSYIISNETPRQRFQFQKQSPMNRSYDSLVDVDAVRPQKSIQKTSDSSFYSWNVDPTSESYTSVPGSRLSSIMTAQPWSGPKYTTHTTHKAVPTLPSSPLKETSSHKGLTKTLLDDFEERRARLKLEESAYAGIQPVDDINNEVVEVTRVIRHKNTRALRWEAGVYANEEND